MTQPLVTIGIPAFNSETTIERAVSSVRAQTRNEWILLLSDDGSADGTWDACRAAAASDARITAWRQPERRMFLNFGDVLARARTPYFAWLAADDHWAPDFLRDCIAALEARADAVSALPKCAFIGEAGQPGPQTDPLEGSVPARLRSYLEHPGGTRMYGLARTEILQRAFPRRNMNAYDWHIMLGVLRSGVQIEVPRVLLYREKTDWMHYAEVVDDLYGSRLFRRFPVLDMSLQAVRAGFVPVSVLGALVRLNFRKHAEYLAVTRPAEFARRIWIFRLFGLRLARPDIVSAIAETLIRRDPVRRDGAVEILRREQRRGNARAALVLGHAMRDGFVPGDPADAYAAAAAMGSSEGLYHETKCRSQRGEITAGDAWPRILGAAYRGSRSAQDYVRDRMSAGRLPDTVADVAARLLPDPNERPRPDSGERP